MPINPTNWSNTSVNSTNWGATSVNATNWTPGSSVATNYESDDERGVQRTTQASVARLLQDGTGRYLQ